MFDNSRKRARLDSDAASDVGQRLEIAREAGAVVHGYDRGGLKRDEEFWYDDGSVILTAGDTEFRVFKGVLAKHSPVFKDMFSLPQPPNPPLSPAGEQCPVVCLTDSPDEVRYLLRACLPTVGADRYLPQDPTYNEIASLIRLGHKYQLQHLVESSIAYLRRYYTNDFDTWNALGRVKHPPRFQPYDAIGVVNLARFIGCMQLLPSALLAVCSLKPANSDFIFSGVPSAAPESQAEKLSMDDIRLCYFARTKLASAKLAIRLRMCEPMVAATCKRQVICRAAFAGIISIQYKKVDALGNISPFRPLSSFLRSVRNAVCPECYTMLEERELCERRTMWKKLPDLLGVVVDGWVAEDADAAAPQDATA